MSKRNGCAGKVRHRSKIGACIAVKRTGRNVAMNVYKCPACGFWHLGHSRDPYRMAARIDQVLGNHERELQKRLADRDATSTLAEEKRGPQPPPYLVNIGANASPC